MKIGLFFGSFNPIHIGHLVMANYMASYTDLDEVWIVVSPHNPLKDKNALVSVYDRLEMAKLATEQAPHLRVSDIEVHLPVPSYTIDTLTHLKERYPDKDFALIMGADNLQSFKKWKNYEQILNNYSIYVYPRPGADVSEWTVYPQIIMTQTPLMEISSTFIRKAFQKKQNIQFLVPENVLSFMESKNMYR
ncbi:MAG: nicotinate-nucleotide adenylyltransferase [Pedobacter sp.]|nr:MAG: nicotinate-nucleotide adenylyltransferase [Pedobacter sp.]